MIGSYRFLKTKGHTYFAHIILDLQIAESGIQILTDYDSIMNDWIEEDYFSPELWIEVAQKSIKITSQFIIDDCKEVSGVQVTLKKVLGTFLDTDEHTIFCATALALLQLFPNIERDAELLFEAHWKIRVRDKIISL